MKRFANASVHPLLSSLFVVLFCCFAASGSAYATSAGINSPGKVEGAFDISGSASFEESVNGPEGTVYLYIDGSYHGGKTFEGTSVSWKYSEITGRMLDAGGYSQGEHTIKAVAVAANGTSAEATGTFTIDNTPKVTVNSPGQVTGAFDFSGTATFKERTSGPEGTVYLFIDGSYHGGKTFEGTNVSWKYSEITGRMLDAGGYSQGEHTIKAVAVSINGTSAEATGTFTIDNTPKVTVNSPGQVTGAFDFSGTATFKERTSGPEGTVYLFIDGSYHGGKTFEGTSVSWKYSEITGRMLNAGGYSQGEHTIKAVAVAINGTSAETKETFCVGTNNSPCQLANLNLGPSCSERQ